jgi:colanic acid biosynthesis glycosyl transferase WcaI
MRILYLTQWFDPEPAVKDAGFARALVDAGHKVEVATGFPNYPGGKLYPGYRLGPYRTETINGVKVHRLWLFPSHDASSLKRVFNYLSFFLSTLIFGLLRGGRYDLIYIYHPPLTPALAAALFCKVHRKHFIVEIQDLWPDSVSASGMANPNIVRVLERACAFVYRRAARIVSQSNGMKAELIRRGVPAERLATIFNWATYLPPAPGQDLPDDIAAAFAGRINLVYGGNIGQAQQLGVLVDAAVAAHRSNRAIRLHLVGGGIEREPLRQKVRDLLADDAVHFHPPIARDIMDRVFDAADILVMHLKHDPLYLITIPSKTQHYLACGKPIVAGLPGEAADILKQSGGAIVCAPGDAAAMAEGLERIAAMTVGERRTMGARARACYDANFSMSRAVEKTVQLIEEQR